METYVALHQRGMGWRRQATAYRATSQCWDAGPAAETFPMKLARDLPEFYQETKPEKLVGARGYGGGATMSMVVASEGKDWKMNWISRVLVGWEEL